MPVTPGKTPNMSRQASNLSKPGSRQTPGRPGGQNKKPLDVGDPDFDLAMQKQLSSLEKKSTRSSMGGTMPRLGAPAVETPKLGTPAKSTLEEPLPEQINEIELEKGDENIDKENLDSTKEKSKKRKRKTKGENKSGENAEYSDDFETDSDDEISKVRDENNKFVQEKFNAVMKALSETSELPDLSDVDFEEYLGEKRQILIERERNHTEWLEGFIKKKENVFVRLGIISKSRHERFNNVCDITCDALGIDKFPVRPPKKQSLVSRRNSLASQAKARSRSRSRETSQERGRTEDRSRERSRDRSRETSQAKSREKSFERVNKNNSDLLPEIVDIKEELAAAVEEKEELAVATEDKEELAVAAEDKEELAAAVGDNA